jgi:peptidoglycan/LPS O-acetylase OafA/YrhL
MTRRRLLAVAALVLAPLAVIAAVTYVTDDPENAFGVVLTLSLALLAAGFGLARRGVPRIVALMLAGLLFLGALEALLDRRVVDRLFIAGLFWLAVSAAYAAFAIHVPLRRAARPRRPVLFINPRSGGGKAERFRLADEARRREIEPVELRPATI